ncbi:hypothetical protein F4803DRAFT_547802 [Xylaria telfairii]|nr:hypothetical protein F4803DRAFT_547802 [Xylaria telfairii]
MSETLNSPNTIQSIGKSRTLVVFAERGGTQHPLLPFPVASEQLGTSDSDVIEHTPAYFSAMVTPEKLPCFKDNVELLRWFYQDITRLSQIAAPDIVWHVADGRHTALRGIAAAQRRVELLKAATGGTLFMDVESAFATEHMGVVHGLLRARQPHLQDLALHFQGFWRFRDGVVVEHTEILRERPNKLDKWLWHAKYRLVDDEFYPVADVDAEGEVAATVRRWWRYLRAWVMDPVDRVWCEVRGWY